MADHGLLPNVVAAGSHIPISLEEVAIYVDKLAVHEKDIWDILLLLLGTGRDFLSQGLIDDAMEPTFIHRINGNSLRTLRCAFRSCAYVDQPLWRRLSRLVTDLTLSGEDGPLQSSACYMTAFFAN